MKKIIYTILFSLPISSVLVAQANDGKPLGWGHGNKTCGFDESEKQMKLKRNALYQYTLNRSSEEERDNLNGRARQGADFIIPVVFHVLHQNGADNVSDAQINDAIRILNEDFSTQNSDISEVIEAFRPIVGNPNIEFRLAKIAPNGRCFEGITRTVRTTTSGDNEIQIQEIIDGNNIYNGIWPHINYLNIIVCDSLIDGAAGYTYRPVGWDEPDQEHMVYNSIYMLSNYIGEIGTGTSTRKRTLTHEVGHWLNLMHPWGAGELGNCNDDEVADTPTTMGNSGCNLNSSTCDNTLDNVQNYMDYSYCSRHFTQGQVNRMIDALYSYDGGRYLIFEEENLINVGVQGNISICNAVINAEKKNICKGETNSYTLSNTIAGINTYSWTFEGGTPATSSLPNPQITYNEGGRFDVMVTVTGAFGTQTFTLDKYLFVDEVTTAANLPLLEGFVEEVFPPLNWTITSEGQNYAWQRSSDQGLAPSSGNSAMINAGNNTLFGAFEDLNLAPMDLTNVGENWLEFDMAYRAKLTTRTERLEVMVSSGCGVDFEIVYAKHHGDLATENPSTLNYINPSIWRKEKIDLSQYSGNANVRVRFRVYSERQGILYLDNVNWKEGPNENRIEVNPQTICLDRIITFVDGIGNGINYQWNFGSNATPSTASGEGPHQVVYANVGPKAITTTIDGVIYTKDIIVEDCLEVTTINGTQWAVFPNPTYGEATVISNDQIINVEILDQTGKVVLKQSGINLSSCKIELNHLSQGAYLLKVRTDNGDHVQKIIKF